MITTFRGPSRTVGGLCDNPAVQMQSQQIHRLGYIYDWEPIGWVLNHLITATANHNDDVTGKLMLCHQQNEL